MGTKIAVAALLLVWIVINFALARPGIDTITVWGKIKIAIKGSNKAKMVLAENLTFPSLPEDLKIKLSGEGYSQTITNLGGFAGTQESGRFEFRDVPCEKMMHLGISYQTSLYGKIQWDEKFTFLKGSPSPAEDAKKAGYVGCYTITIHDADPNNSQICCIE